ncbi:MAG: aminoacyl-tRNA hydrolase [Acholeplasmataceae bacterium]|jgi:PTH1 family peptidyl-tRNA hydrolase
MKLIIGLGNPGLKYKKTRHNLGFMVVDELARQLKLKFKYNHTFKSEIIETLINNEKVIIVKPFTYMNLSGAAVSKIINYYKIDFDDMIVIVDDLALDVGKLRLREFGSDGGHNGLKNIDTHLSNAKYKRIRIGIGENKLPEVNDYVLGTFSKAEEKIIKQAILDAVDALKYFIDNKPYLDIMTLYNTPK